MLFEGENMNTQNSRTRILEKITKTLINSWLESLSTLGASNMKIKITLMFKNIVIWDSFIIL